MDNLHFLINTLYTLHEIPMYCFHSSTLAFCAPKEGSEQNPFQRDPYLLSCLAQQHHGTPALIEEDTGILYGICGGSDGLMCIIGPFSIETLNRMTQRSYKEKHHMEDCGEFMVYLDNLNSAASILSLLNLELNHTQVSTGTILGQLQERGNPSSINENDMFLYSLKNSENHTKHISYAREKSLTTVFASGNAEALEEYFDPALLDHVGQLAASPYKQLEYTAVGGIHFYSRAALESGVDPETAYSLSDLYLQKLSVCKTELELYRLMVNVKTDMFNQVKKVKEQKNRYRYIEQAKQFIARNLYSRFTLDDIADSVGLNKCYLSTQFSSHEGKTLIRYIQEERVCAAKNMLRYSDLSISVIANYLCFDSQSHLGSVFRKIAGTTPAAYRMANQTENFRSDRQTFPKNMESCIKSNRRG